jgi:hypothetical protein
MKSYGHVDFQGNEVQNAILKLSSEVNFPTVPTIGRVLFKDSIVYICVEIAAGTPTWIPLTNEIMSYLHIQDTPSATWTIVHDLYTLFPLVQIYGDDNLMVIPESIETVSNTTVVVNFGTAVTGRGSVIIGNTDGNPRQNVAYEHDQTTPSATWIVNHNLGYYPVIRVFIGLAEVQPESIVHNSINQATITFSTPQVGVARCA